MSKQTPTQIIQSAANVIQDDWWGMNTDAAVAKERSASIARVADRRARGMQPGLATDGSEIPNAAGVPADFGFTGIYDFNHASLPDWKRMHGAGIAAVLLKASQGYTWTDDEFTARRAHAENLGFLVGGYHFSTSGNVAQQVKNFLGATGTDPKFLRLLDWEEDFQHGSAHNMSRVEAEEFVERVFDATGVWPMVYGGGLLRDEIGDHASESLSKCPLMYCQIQDHPLPTGIPAQVWPKGATFHQYFGDDGPNARGPSFLPCVVPGCPGADRSRFLIGGRGGTEAELRAAWPVFGGG